MAIILILAIIALIATPIVLNVIEGSKKSSVLRSGELYLKGVEQKILEKNLKDEFNPSTCIIQSDGDLICDGVELEIKASGEKPTGGKITLKNKNITDVKNMLLNNYLLEMDTKRKLIIKDDESSDITPPEVFVNLNKVTTNSIKITVEATDEESEITGYYYSLNNKNSYSEGQKVQEFSNLKAGTSYTIYVKVVNEEELETEESVTKTTLTINMPSVEIDKSDWAVSKEVTITYPTVQGQNLIYSYQKDGEGWTTTQDVVTKVTFDSAGTIVAKVTDGTEQNTLTTISYTVDKIDTEDPIVAATTGLINVDQKGREIKVTASDVTSGVSRYCITTTNDSSTCSWNSSEDGSYTYYKGTGTYFVFAKDKAGRASIGKQVSVTISYASSGLYVYYDNKDRGTTSGKWKDLSGNGNDGTINGATWKTDGLYFDGTNDWVSIGYNPLTTITLESFFYVPAEVTSAQILIGNHDGGGHDLAIQTNGDLLTASHINGSYSILEYTGLQVQPNIKYHVVYTYDGSTQHLYINGALVMSKLIKGTVGQTTNNTIWALGANPTRSTVSDAYFKGTMSLARIYNRALTEEEVKGNYLSAQ